MVTSPALGRCWWAVRGGGAFESSWPRDSSNARRLMVSSTSQLGESLLEALDDESRDRLPPSGARPPASPLPWWSWFVARSTASWLSAISSGITHRGFSSFRKLEVASPIEPVVKQAIGAEACTQTPTCTVNSSLGWTTPSQLADGSKLGVSGHRKHGHQSTT